MKFDVALRYMQNYSGKAKRPSWSGYWTWDKEKETIMMWTGKTDKNQTSPIDIRDTQRVGYTLNNINSADWIIADESNTPLLGGTAKFGFDEAIRYVKRGLKVSRSGWNGKRQYIELATNVSYKNADGEIVNVEHREMGNKAIAFVGTSGVQLGWLASQADMLAEDWVFYHEKEDN